MKRFLIVLSLVFGSQIVSAQVFNNEWINYSLTYYKFKVGYTGLYRITQPELAAIGQGNTGAQNFKLWRNGQEIALYTSIATGSLSATDYIEFYGERNDTANVQFIHEGTGNDNFVVSYYELTYPRQFNFFHVRIQVSLHYYYERIVYIQ